MGQILMQMVHVTMVMNGQNVVMMEVIHMMIVMYVMEVMLI